MSFVPLDFPSRGGASRNLWEKTPDGARAACPFHAPALVQSGVTRLCVVLAAYGAYAFLYRELIYPLTMNSAFMPWNGNEHVLFFLLDYGVIFLSVRRSGHMLSRLMRKRNAPVLRPAEAWD